MTEVLSMTNDAIATSAENQTATDLSRGQLKLSDIIFILSPENEIFHNKTFFINYIDKDSAFIVDIDTGKSHKLRFHKTGSIGDGTIQTIKVVKRNEEDGYARQNGLLPGKWLNIYFNGDTPFGLHASQVCSAVGRKANPKKKTIIIATAPLQSQQQRRTCHYRNLTIFNPNFGDMDATSGAT